MRLLRPGMTQSRPRVHYNSFAWSMQVVPTEKEGFQVWGDAQILIGMTTCKH